MLNCSYIVVTRRAKKFLNLGTFVRILSGKMNMTDSALIRLILERSGTKLYKRLANLYEISYLKYEIFISAELMLTNDLNPLISGMLICHVKVESLNIR